MFSTLAVSNLERSIDVRSRQLENMLLMFSTLAVSSCVTSSEARLAQLPNTLLMVVTLELSTPESAKVVMKLHL